MKTMLGVVAGEMKADTGGVAISRDGSDSMQ